MGKIEGKRQVTLYIEPELYERVRCSAYLLNEDIYEFVSESLKHSVDRRIPDSKRAAVNMMAKQNIEHGGSRRPRKKPGT